MTISVWESPVYVEMSGSGEPALFLHGNPDSGHVWSEIVPKVNTQYRCYVPDCPGYRYSPVPPSFRFDFDGYADWVNALLNALDIRQPITLVMHDWGGILGMCFAAKYPQRVKRIVGGDFPFTPDYRWHKPWAQVWRTPLLGELSLLLMNWPLFNWEMRRGSRRLSTAQLRATYNNIGGWRSKQAILRYYRSANPQAYKAWWPKVQALAAQVPIDLIWGADDYYVPLAEGKAISHRQFTALEGIGHWVPLECPEAYIEALSGRN